MLEQYLDSIFILSPVLILFLFLNGHNNDLQEDKPKFLAIVLPHHTEVSSLVAWPWVMNFRKFKKDLVLSCYQFQTEILRKLIKLGSIGKHFTGGHDKTDMLNKEEFQNSAIMMLCLNLVKISNKFMRESYPPNSHLLSIEL